MINTLLRLLSQNSPFTKRRGYQERGSTLSRLNHIDLYGSIVNTLFPSSIRATISIFCVWRGKVLIMLRYFLSQDTPTEIAMMSEILLMMINDTTTPFPYLFLSLLHNTSRVHSPATNNNTIAGATNL